MFPKAKPTPWDVSMTSTSLLAVSEPTSEPAQAGQAAQGDDEPAEDELPELADLPDDPIETNVLNEPHLEAYTNMQLVAALFEQVKQTNKVCDALLDAHVKCKSMVSMYTGLVCKPVNHKPGKPRKPGFTITQLILFYDYLHSMSVYVNTSLSSSSKNGGRLTDIRRYELLNIIPHLYLTLFHNRRWERPRPQICVTPQTRKPHL